MHNDEPPLEVLPVRNTMIIELLEKKMSDFEKGDPNFTEVLVARIQIGPNIKDFAFPYNANQREDAVKRILRSVTEEAALKFLELTQLQGASEPIKNLIILPNGNGNGTIIAPR